MKTSASSRKNLIILSIVGILLFTSGFLISRFTDTEKVKKHSEKTGKDDSIQMRRTHTDDLGNQVLDRLINPLLDCEGSFEEISPKFSDDLNIKVQELSKKPGIRTISLYFRQMGEGRWIGIRERDMFVPASLLKVPLMIAAYRQLEETPSVTNQKYPFDDSVPTPYPNRIPGSKALTKGKAYTLEELIEYMIVYSDNNAATIIKNAVNPKILNHVFQDLGLKSVEDVQGVYGISARDYGTFLRILYNATYLSRLNSAKALETLSRVEYKNGLVAKLPPNVIVAHKFGERESENGKQLHDCGIVYSDTRVGDYLVCIMVKGDNDYKPMEEVISELSKFIYEESGKQIITR